MLLSVLCLTVWQQKQKRGVHAKQRAGLKLNNTLNWRLVAGIRLLAKNVWLINDWQEPDKRGRGGVSPAEMQVRDVATSLRGLTHQPDVTHSPL